MSRPGDLVLMGPPGVGKGTQARLLADRAAWVQLATGDLFRTHLSMRTELGVLAEGYMNKGAYVPDEVTIQMVRERLKEIGAERRIMFDGFPRTVPQAEALDRLLADVGRRIGAVVVIEAPRDELVKRLAGRGRPDDTREVSGKRLDVYAEQTEPVIAFYDKRGVVRRVNGVGPIDEITERLLAASE